MGDIDRRHVAGRHDHAHAHRGHVEQAFGEVEGQPHAAVGRRTPRQHAAMEGDARPGDAMHVRHEGVVVQVRVMLLDFLDDAEDPGGRFAPLRAARHRRPQDPSLGVVDGDPLATKGNDRHDGLAGAARLNRLHRAFAHAAPSGSMIPRRDQRSQSCNSKTGEPQPSLPVLRTHTPRRHAPQPKGSTPTCRFEM